MVDLDVLRTFLAVYRFESITRAAASVNLSQPAVSQQIKALETHVGGPLFSRLPRGVAPTERAHQLAQTVAPHLDALAGLVSGGEEGTPRRTVYLGGPAEFMAVHAMVALGPLVSTGLLLRTRLGLTGDLLTALAHRELDLVVATAHSRREGLTMEPLYQEELVLVGNPVWHERQAEPVASGDDKRLSNIPLLAYAEDLPIVRRYWRLVFRSPVVRSPVMVIPDLRALVSAAVSGVGITVLPRYLCEKELRSGQLVDMHRPLEPPQNTLYLAWRSDSLHERRISMVRDALLSAVFEP